jgi:hypothetical protein
MGQPVIFVRLLALPAEGAEEPVGLTRPRWRARRGPVGGRRTIVACHAIARRAVRTIRAATSGARIGRPLGTGLLRT